MMSRFAVVPIERGETRRYLLQAQRNAYDTQSSWRGGER